MAGSNAEFNGGKLRLALTRAEALALFLGLREYIYFVEEGNIREVLDEAEIAPDEPLLSAAKAVALERQLSEFLDRAG